MKYDLKTILANMTDYFDSLFKDKKTKIIILCSICTLIIVGIVSCFAITSSAQEPRVAPPVPEPNSGYFINEIIIYPGLVAHQHNSTSSYVYGLIEVNGTLKHFNTLSWSTINDVECLVVSERNTIVDIIYNDDSAHFLILGEDDLYGELTYDSNNNLVAECILSVPYNLLGYWKNLGGWSCPSSLDTFLVNGRILDDNWQPYGTIFSEVYLGYNDYIPTDDYVMFLGSRGPYTVDNQTPVYLQIESLSTDSTWYDNVLLSWYSSIGGGDFYDTPPGLSLLESGYYLLKDNPGILGDAHLDFLFTTPLDNPRIQFAEIYIESTTGGSNPYSRISYRTEEGNTVDIYRSNLDSTNAIFLEPSMRVIKLEYDTLVPTEDYNVFMNAYSYSNNDIPYIDYENGYNNGYNEGLSQSFIANFFEGIVKALDQLTIFYGFSFLTIIQTVLGFSVLLWILKLIAGG